MSQNLIGHTIGPEEHATCFKSVRAIFLKKCAKEHGKGNTLELTCILMSHVSWGSTSVTFTHNSHTPRTSTARWTNRWVAYFREPAWQWVSQWVSHWINEGKGDLKIKKKNAPNLKMRMKFEASNSFDIKRMYSYLTFDEKDLCKRSLPSLRPFML